MIVFSDVTKRYGKFTALDSFSLSVSAGEAVALWGPNGAGKTTAMKCLLDLLRYQGKITVDGLDAHKNGREARRRIGYVPQQISFYPELRTLETVCFFARLNRTPCSEAADLLAQVGLADHASKAVGALSGGMKQRLALAVALLGDPPVLVLDEPTTNLDAEAREHFLHLLSDVHKDGKTTFFTSHRYEEVERLADRVVVMQAGRALLTTTGEELAERTGLRTIVKLRMPAQQVNDALGVLSSLGFRASRNGVGLLVEVRPGEKARPIQALSRAAIDVTDFELDETSIDEMV
jgi:ABC-type multidrug transport system ATPase subunit